MRIQKLSGGLANQMFQYAFMRYGQLADPTSDWYLDDSEYFIRNVYNGYELEEVFGVKPKLLSQAFDADVWEQMITLRNLGLSIPQVLKDFDTDIVVYCESKEDIKDFAFNGKVYNMGPAGGFYPDIVKLDFPNVYYEGSWVDKNWFNSNRQLLLKEFSFPEEASSQVRLHREHITGGKSVGMHVRRGDFVYRGMALEPDYYKNALIELNKKYDDYTVFVFSDDLYWCNQHSGELGLNFAPKVEYISGNFKAGSFHDLELLAMCDILIMANSAFSYMAGIMNEKLELFMDPVNRKWMI